MLTKIIGEMKEFSSKMIVLTEDEFEKHLNNIIVNEVSDLPPETSEWKLVQNIRDALIDLFELLKRKLVILYDDEKYCVFNNGIEVYEEFISYIYNKVSILKLYNEFMNKVRKEGA